MTPHPSTRPRPAWVGPAIGFVLMVLATLLAACWVNARDAGAIPLPRHHALVTLSPGECETNARWSTTLTITATE